MQQKPGHTPGRVVCADASPRMGAFCEQQRKHGEAVHAEAGASVSWLPT